MMLVTAACIRPGDERAEFDTQVGRDSRAGVSLRVADGLAHVRSLDATRATLWAQAPSLSITITVNRPGMFRLEVRNCMPLAQAFYRNAWHPPNSTPRPTHCTFDLELAAGETEVFVGPTDSNDATAFQVAVFGDIQTGLPDVGDVFDAISEANVRFVLCTGDIVEESMASEYDLYLAKLEHLTVPVFATIGNHELIDPTHWRRLFGRHSIHFSFKGAYFSFVDSANASINPTVYGWLDNWLDAAAEHVHIFGTHYPPLDPVGARSASFRSRNEASKLLAKLARGRVDLTLYGHIHSRHEFENAGIPAYVSGGGGAIEERLDGIGRHFLVLDIDAGQTLTNVSTVRVD